MKNPDSHTEPMEHVGRIPAPPLDQFIDDIYCLTGVPPHRLMNVPPMPSAHFFLHLSKPVRLWDSDRAWFMGVWTEALPLRVPPPACAARRRALQKRDHEQAVAFVPARVVLAVLDPGAPPGTYHRAVQQHHTATLSGDLLQGPVQARGAGGQQPDDLPHPASDGGAMDAVAACQVAGPLVTTQYRQHDAGDLPRGQGPPPGADLLEVAA
ncbi:hypothetical protein [Streptomyces sp. NRRL S-646]|uniref:hypothetical protein n=1 Tax=Streptomyces sp. NRRL S-646 TaxID=1463917 RepID=UPI001F19844C